jgi:D-2-hydroxyglutarate dehydrogenase
MKSQNLFSKILKPSQIVTDFERLAKFNSDWMNFYHGESSLALIPRTTFELSQIMRICNDNKLPVVTVGGNTSLVGGATPFGSEIVISTEKMNNFTFNNKTGILKAQAGCILQNIQESIEVDNFETPYNLGARGTCTVGGNIATCAGGINFIKYGSLRGYIMGLEVVLASGEILNFMKEIPKDNTGLDMKQIFIGQLIRVGRFSWNCYRSQHHVPQKADR